MSDALRYASRPPGGRALVLTAPQGAVTRLHLPDPQSKSRFVAAVANARCEKGDALELLGEDVARLRRAGRARLLRRVSVLSPAVTLITNLNAWENILLPAAYHGSPSREEVARTTQEVLEAFVAEPLALLSRLPEQLNTLQRRLVSFVRLLVVAPELALMDALDEGLSREECACIARFEAQYRNRHPSGTLLFVDAKEDAS